MRGFGASDPDARRARALVAPRGERATTYAVTVTGELVVTTSEALHVGELRLPWDRIAKATWDDDEVALTVVGSPAPGEPSRTVVLPFEAPGRLVEMVRLQVTSNIVVSQRIDSATFGGAWITARRVPGGDEVRWAVVFDPGRDPRDPALRAWADAHVAALKASTGV